MLIRHLLTITFIFVSLFGCYTNTFATENTFYVLRSNAPSQISTAENALDSLTQHYKNINILISQAYQVNDKGIVWGFVDPAIADFVTKHKINLMLLITNAGFSKESAHHFLENTNAQQRAIQAVLAACKIQHAYGVQFDFEMVALEDRDALTRFYQTAAEALHKKGYVVSFAIAPVVSDSAQPSEFLKKIYVNWEGAYDFEKLGKAGDFVTIMAYNQHGDGTTPGPTAGYRWVEAAVKYALQHIPAEKISLGIPAYSTYIFTGTEGNHCISQSTGITYNKALYLLHKYKADLAWDKQDKLNYSIYQHDWLNEYLFVEDAKSFSAKLTLEKKYHLRGISVFDLGSEDPHIWQYING